MTHFKILFAGVLLLGLSPLRAEASLPPKVCYVEKKKCCYVFKKCGYITKKIKKECPVKKCVKQCKKKCYPVPKCYVKSVKIGKVCKADYYGYEKCFPKFVKKKVCKKVEKCTDVCYPHCYEVPVYCYKIYEHPKYCPALVCAKVIYVGSDKKPDLKFGAGKLIKVEKTKDYVKL